MTLDEQIDRITDEDIERAQISNVQKQLLRTYLRLRQAGRADAQFAQAAARVAQDFFENGGDE